MNLIVHPIGEPLTPEEAERIVLEAVERAGVPQRFVVGPTATDLVVEHERSTVEMLRRKIEEMRPGVAAALGVLSRPEEC